MAEFFDTAAELGSEEEDEDFDEESGKRQRGANGIDDMQDSSEEEEEDDDERLRAVSRLAEHWLLYVLIAYRKVRASLQMKTTKKTR